MTRDNNNDYHSERTFATPPNLAVTLCSGRKPRGFLSGGFSHGLEEYLSLALQASYVERIAPLRGRCQNEEKRRTKKKPLASLGLLEKNACAFMCSPSHRRLLGGSMCAQILVSTLSGMPARGEAKERCALSCSPRCIALYSKWPSSLAERGSVFTPSPLLGNPYALQFSKYDRTLLTEEVTSGNSEAKARNAYHCR
jgi:hypothetical protein